MILNKGEYISHGNFQGRLDVVDGRIGILRNIDKCGLFLFTKGVRGNKNDFINTLVHLLGRFAAESFCAVFYDHRSNKLYLLTNANVATLPISMSQYDLVNEEVLLADRFIFCSDVIQLHDYFFEIGVVISRI